MAFANSQGQKKESLIQALEDGQELGMGSMEGFWTALQTRTGVDDSLQ